MKPEMKKLIIANLPYLLFVYLFGKLGQTYRLAAGADLSEKLLHLADGFSLAFESAAPSFHLFDLAVGVAGAVALRLMVYCKSKNAKKYRRGVEYGSARWGGPKDIEQQEVYLSTNEFEVLYLLLQSPQTTFTKEQIYEQIWHEPTNNHLHAVENTIFQIRKRLKPYCKGHEYIKTVIGYGYKFNSE